jgi:broad specificity phosphatase PhoE
MEDNNEILSPGNGFDLTQEGIKQAMNLSLEIKDEVDLLYSGADFKSVSTGKVISKVKKVPLTINDSLDDIYMGDWEGKSKKEIMENYPQEYQIWLNVPYKMEFPKGETVDEFKNRIIGMLRSVIHKNEGKTILFVTSDYPLNLLFSYFSGRDYKELSFSKKFKEATFYTIDIENGKFQLV